MKKSNVKYSEEEVDTHGDIFFSEVTIFKRHYVLSVFSY